VIRTSNIDIEEETDEIRIITMANTVVDPRTVVIYDKVHEKAG